MWRSAVIEVEPCDIQGRGEGTTPINTSWSWKLGIYPKVNTPVASMLSLALLAELRLRNHSNKQEPTAHAVCRLVSSRPAGRVSQSVIRNPHRILPRCSHAHARELKHIVNGPQFHFLPQLELLSSPRYPTHTTRSIPWTEPQNTAV